MRLVLVACLAVACGRLGYDPLDGDATSPGTDGTVGDAAAPASDAQPFVPTCAPRAGALWRSTLDDVASVQTPAVGAVGSGVATSTDHVPAMCGNGLRLDAPGEVIEIDQITAGSTHFDSASGALELWYQPLYATSDGLEHRLYGCSDLPGGGVRVAKSASGDFVVAVHSIGGQIYDTIVAAADVPFVPATWVNVAISWDFTGAADTEHVRVWFDGVEPPYLERGLGPVAIDQANDSESCFVGGYDIDDPGSALGALDEVVFYADPR